MKKKCNKIFLILCNLLFFAILIIGMSNFALRAKAAVIVEMNEKTFPDKIFREYIASQCSSGEDGLSDVDIREIYSINVDGMGISDLTGIEYFKNLLSLSCDDNNISKLDVSKNTKLSFLSCQNSHVSELNISKNKSLEYLYCYNNNISKLDVSKNPALKVLGCGYNNISELNISNNIVLETISCLNNNISALDVGNNKALIDLDCMDNNISKLDVNRNTLLKSLVCNGNNINELNLSKNSELDELDCSYNNLTQLKLNSKTYGKLELLTSNLHSENSTIYDISNATLKYGTITVTDITKPATYKYSCSDINNGALNDFTIIYVDTTNNNFIKPSCSHLFYDYDYTSLVTGSPVVIYGNGMNFKLGNTRINNKQFIAYTDILASYNYAVNDKGIVKSSAGKVIVGITESDFKPFINKNKIVDKEAEKIAKAKIRNGVITVTAIGKEKGTVYLWIIDTGKNGVSECCPINVQMAPRKLEVQDMSGNKLKSPKLENGKSLDVHIAGIVSGATKTEDCTYIATVDSKYQDYIEVEQNGASGDNFVIKAVGLKNDKKTKAVVTFQCEENNKKTKFSLTITE